MLVKKFQQLGGGVLFLLTVLAEHIHSVPMAARLVPVFQTQHTAVAQNGWTGDVRPTRPAAGRPAGLGQSPSAQPPRELPARGGRTRARWRGESSGAWLRTRRHNHGRAIGSAGLGDAVDVGSGRS
jgi:hypothetical protein